MPLNQKVARSLLALKQQNFSQYLKALEALGVDISQELQTGSLKQLAEQKLQGKKQQHLQSFESSFFAATSKEDIFKLYGITECFARVWTSAKYAKSLSSIKQDLNTTTRHHVHLGMLALHQILRSQLANEELFITFDLQTLKEMESAINTAILTYQTSKQKLIHVLGKGLVTAASFSFGMIQTTVAVFFVGLLLFTPSGLLALGSLLAVALSCGGVFSYINYCTQKDDIPYILNELAGKDRWFQGFLQFKNAKGEMEALNNKQITALALFTALFALPAAIASGAFGFTSVLSIPSLLTMFGISVTVSIFTPFALAIAAVIAVTMTLYTLRAFHAFIAYDHGNLLTFIRKPFDDVCAILNEKIDAYQHPLLNKIAKITALTVCGVVCTMATMGLAISSLAGINSVAALMTRLFQAPLVVSASIGVALGGVISFVSRSFFTIKKCGNAVVNLMKLACHQSDTTVNKLGLITGIVIDLPLSAFFWLDAFLRPPAVLPLLPMPTTLKAAGLATSCTTVKDAGLVINSMFQEKSPAKDIILQTPSGTYAESIKTAKTLVKIPQPLVSYSFFKNVDAPTVAPAPLDSHKLSPG